MLELFKVGVTLTVQIIQLPSLGRLVCGFAIFFDDVLYTERNHQSNQRGKM